MSEKIKKLITFICISILLFSLLSILSPGMESTAETSEKIVLVKEDLTRSGVDKRPHEFEIIDEVGGYSLVKTDIQGIGRLKEKGIAIDELPRRTEISVKGHTFDISDGGPDLTPEMMIDDYRAGERGLYIVHMLGPVDDGWRKGLENEGVEIINYVPNYAYEVRMTPEQAQKVEDLYFVDWVDTYHPGFKLDEGVEPGKIDVKFVGEVGKHTLHRIEKVSSLSIVDIRRKSSTVTVEARTREGLHELAHMSEVYYITEHIEYSILDEVATQIIAGGSWIWDPEDDPYNPWRGYDDDFTHGSRANHLGWTGKGETVAVADTGINPDHTDFQNRVIGGQHWNGTNTWEDDHGHGSHVAGSIAGNTYEGTGTTIDEFSSVEEMGPYYAAQGPAFDSELFSVKIFDSGGDWIGPDDYFDVVQAAKQNSDSYIHSNSWGADENLGEYLDSSEAYDEAVRDSNRSSNENEPMVIVVASGNQGSNYNTVGAPATGKNIIAVGSTENFMPDLGTDNPDRISSFSSRGWTDDNRVKPDIVAPGEDITSVDYGSNEGYVTMSGTSMATPAVSGAASVVVEWYENRSGYKPSPAMVRASLINTAHDLNDDNGNTGPIPNRDEGWGMVDLPALIDAPSNFTFKDQNQSLTTGDVEEYTINYENSSEPLKITLTWTDKEAQTGDTKILKNDLDLSVVSPEGREYRGNAFEDGWTQPYNQTIEDFDDSGDGWDDVNNVENVYIPANELELGDYTVKVSGEDIPADANNDGTASQDFALAMYNVVEEPEGESPSIEITRPTGGEVWDAETQEDIYWNTTQGDDQISHVNLYYSVDGGDTWEVINTELADTGEYAWNVPDENSTDSNVLLEVVDEAGRTNESMSGSFTIDGKPPDPPKNLDVKHGGDHKNDNLISWDASPEDPNEVTHYNIYRAENKSDLGSVVIDSVDADGSDRYEYVDENKGMVDETFWWYLVRAIDIDGLEEENENATQEPVGSFQVEIIERDQRAIKDQNYTIKYNVTNIGQSEETQTINFSVDDEVLSQKEVNLEPEQDYLGEFVWTPDALGDHSLKVSSEDHSDGRQVEVLQGHHFEINSIMFERNLIEGEEIQVNYTIENTGDIEDTQNIEFKVVEFGINGEIVYEDREENITLQSEERFDGMFTWQTEEGNSGDYELDITTKDETDSSLVSVYEKGIFAVDVNSKRDFYIGKNIEVNYTVMNTKDNTTTQDIEFTVLDDRGEEIHSDFERDVTLESKESFAGAFGWNPDETGYYEVSVASEDHSEKNRIRIWESGSFSVIAQMCGRSEGRMTTVDDRVSIEYIVRNTKEMTDTQDIEIYIDDEPLEVVEDVTLGSGEEYRDEFTWDASEPFGERVLSFRSDDASAQITLEVYEGTYLEVQIDRPEEGQTFESNEEITVEFTVTNTGDLKGEQNISIVIDGDIVEKTSFKLEPDDSETHEFSFYADENRDSHQIKVASGDDYDVINIELETEDGDLNIPGFTTLYLITSILIAILIYASRNKIRNDER